MKTKYSFFTLALLVLLAMAASVSAAAEPVLVAADTPTVFEVTKTADTNDGACTPADCSLREAVIAANMTPGQQTIWLPGGIYRLTIPGTGEDPSQEDAAVGDLDLKDDVVIAGVGPGIAVIDAGQQFRVFHIMAGVSVRLERLTIRNGRSDNGGGMSTNGPTTLVNVTFANNYASHMGGAIHMQMAETTCINCTLRDNGAELAGDGIAVVGGAARIFNSIIANPGFAQDCYGWLQENDHNLIQDGSCGPLLSGDANLGPYIAGYYTPQAGSKVIDAGNDSVCPATDQIGNPRGDGNLDGIIECDIGAIEYPLYYDSRENKEKPDSNHGFISPPG